MTKTLIRHCAAMLVLGASVAEAVGQSPYPLTLHDAVELALKQNPDSQIAHIQTALSQQERAETRAGLLPNVSMQTTETVSRFNLKALIGVRIPDLPNSIGPYQAVHTGVTFEGPVFDLSLIRRYQASNHVLAATRADEQTVREETVLLTVSAYMTHLRALADVAAAESRVQLAESLERQAEDLLSDGVASRIDVSRAQVRLTEEQQALVEARREADTTLYALKRILSLPDSDEIQFVDADHFFATPTVDFSAELDTALTSRPELHELAEDMQAAHAQYGAAVLASLPAVDFEANGMSRGRH